MSKSKLTPLVIGGVGLASCALLAAWLLTGSRKEKTKTFISRRTEKLKGAVSKRRQSAYDDSEVHYI